MHHVYESCNHPGLCARHPTLSPTRLFLKTNPSATHPSTPRQEIYRAATALRRTTVISQVLLLLCLFSYFGLACHVHHATKFGRRPGRGRGDGSCATQLRARRGQRSHSSYATTCLCRLPDQKGTFNIGVASYSSNLTIFSPVW